MKKLIPVLLIVFCSPAGSGQEIGKLSDFGTAEKTKNIGSSVIVFPNPVTDKIVRIKSTALISEIKIINITGKQVYFMKFGYPVQNHQVSLLDEPDGIYLVAVTFSTNEVKAMEIILKGK